MDKEEEFQEIKQKKHPTKYSSQILKAIPKKIIISAIILLILPVIILSIQKPQTVLQQAATNQGAPKDCNAYFYCMTLGIPKNCTHPSICPVQPPPAFVAQSNNVPSGSANGSSNPPSSSASGSPQNPTATPVPSTCPKAPAMLTTKLTILFPTDVGTNNGYTLSAAAMTTLNNFAAALKNFPTTTVTINGYTDNVSFAPGTPGPINTNQALSLARAQAAETYLKSKGATKNTYVVKGNGATNFVAPNNPTTGNVLNRRDEITTNLTANACTPVATKFVQPVCTNNLNWSGYLARIPAKVAKASFSTTWTMAKVTCTGKLIGISQWPGIDAGNKDIAQVGTLSGCTNGKVNNRAWVVHPPNLASVTLPTNMYPANPGDKLTATITMTSLGKFTTTITSVTHKWSYTYPMTFSAADDKLAFQMEAILENEGYGVNPKVPGLTQFTQSAVSGGTYSENGGEIEPLNLAPALYCTNLNDTGNILEDKTSTMTNANYTESWVHQ